jgi:N6-adenosine-specific RNA methylase IME4
MIALGALDDQVVVVAILDRYVAECGQKAFIALEIERRLATSAGLRMATNKHGDPSQIFEKANSNSLALYAAHQAAEMMDTNRQYVHDAKRITREAPDLAQAVMRGDMKITEARRQLQRRTVAEGTPSLPSSKYRVVYADPPWKYGNQGLDDYGHAERHYPAMSTPELCSLDVRGLCEDSAVLFLWVTSPMLPDALRVIEAWGFQYKTSFVWDKVKHNFGHYNSVRHEFLLVCTRGSCIPDVQTLFDSVQSIERTDHSVKPERFREIIDTLYTRGRRIELFSRTEVNGWDNWGNETQKLSL